MRLAVPVALITALALMLPMWLMLPEAADAPEVPPEMAKMARRLGLKSTPAPDAIPRKQQEQQAYIQRYEAYPFSEVLGAGGYVRSMRLWYKDVYDDGDGDKRLGAATELELPGLLQRASTRFEEQAQRTLLFTLVGFLITVVWTPLGIALMKWKANERGPYAYKGTTGTVALVGAGLLVGLVAPFAGSGGELASALLCLPVIDFWVIYYIASRRRNARMPANPGAPGPPMAPAAPATLA